MLVGLPSGGGGFLGEPPPAPTSKPLTLPDLLAGGLALPGPPPPADDTGERMGLGERREAMPPASEVRPARYMLSREPWGPACSAWTTSANEMKLRRRTSVVSKLP
jgi:hypothetical protein